MMEVMGKMKRMITTSTFEVFEKMFFIFFEPVEKKDIVFDMETEIKFQGPVQGIMKLFLSDGLASSMVENMLSLEEEEVTDYLKEDCVREAINMVCGNLLRTYDSSKVFNLSIPTVKRNNDHNSMPVCPDTETNQWQAVFDSDGEILSVLLKMQSP
jgi:CheY-specific phosphatase CheX